MNFWMSSAECRMPIMALLKPELFGLVKKTFVPDGKLVTRMFYFEKLSDGFYY